MSDSRREVDQLVKDLLKQGFEVHRTGSGHWKVTHPDRMGCVIMAFSPRKTGMHRTVHRLKDLGYVPKG